MGKIIFLCSVLVFCSWAHCDLIVGGLTFQDNAFADEVINSGGSLTTFAFDVPNAGTLPEVLTDTDTATFVIGGTNAFVELGFVDNLVINGNGNDLAIFEQGGLADSFLLKINNITLQVDTSFTGEFASDGREINVGLVDLDDYGILSGGSISSIFLDLEQITDAPPAISLVGALNSDSVVPEPSTCVLSLIGLFGLALRKKLPLCRANMEG